MWQYRYSDELYHYGVPGMKWGVRKQKSAVNLSNVKRSTKKNEKVDFDGNATITNKTKHIKSRDEIIRKNEKLKKKVETYEILARRNSHKYHRTHRVGNDSSGLDNDYLVKSLYFRLKARKARKRIQRNEELLKSYDET